MTEWIRDRFAAMGLPAGLEHAATEATTVGMLLLAAMASYFLAKRILLRLIHRVAKRTAFAWDDKLVDEHVFDRISHLAPAIVIHVFAPAASESAALALWMQRAADIYMLVAVLAAANAVLTAVVEIYETHEIARRFPIRVYIQVVRILLAATATIIAISILTGQSPLLLLSGLGAMTAILLLISKDSIQGLVAGVQLVANDMVRVGDWVEVPKYGADGDVIAITLPTVKIQNWDKTISTIPTYAFVADSFKNWRGMAESAGRRIKRSILLDITSIRFCDSELLARLRKIDLLRDYVDSKAAEVADHNRERAVSESTPVNGRRLTNVGMFRQYLVSYLRAHPEVNRDLTLIVRHLQPTNHGLPLEVYAFSANKEWAAYEGIQSDIFDHVYAALPEFDLRAFQTPTGQDAIAALAPLRSGPRDATGSRPASPPAAPSTPAGDC